MQEGALRKAGSRAGGERRPAWEQEAPSIFTEKVKGHWAVLWGRHCRGSRPLPRSRPGEGSPAAEMAAGRGRGRGRGGVRGAEGSVKG